jgi:hypothetical protein
MGDSAEVQGHQRDRCRDRPNRQAGQANNRGGLMGTAKEKTEVLHSITNITLADLYEDRALASTGKE